jgi:hypothetical protein
MARKLLMRITHIQKEGSWGWVYVESGKQVTWLRVSY